MLGCNGAFANLRGCKPVQVHDVHRPRVPAADGPVYALWPSGFGFAIIKVKYYITDACKTRAVPQSLVACLEGIDMPAH